MKYANIGALLVTASFLVACGGGGGGGTEAAGAPSTENTNTETAAVTETPQVTAPLVQQGEVSTAELLVDREYTLNQEFPLALDVNPADRAQSYLSVCSDFDRNKADYAINYNSCLIRTAIDGPAGFNLQVPNAVGELIAVRWHYEGGSEPVYSFWTREQDGDTFSVY